MPSVTPRGAELLRHILDSRLLDVHTALPCEVTAFNAAAQTVDVQPLIKNVIADPDGAELEESYPEIYSVPVIYPRCGLFVVVFPLTVGDVVQVVFNEWSIDNFVQKGFEEHPIDLGRHAFSGAVAFPGGPYPNSSPVVETIDGLILGHDSGAVIRIKTDGTIVLGSTASVKQAVALADDVKARLDTIQSKYDAHVHGGAVGPPVGVELVGALAAVGSSKVTVEK